jgi:hypothetical protein
MTSLFLDADFNTFTALFYWRSNITQVLSEYLRFTDTIVAWALPAARRMS